MIAPYDYSRQFRETPNAPASGHFLMGTDDLGRDRFARFVYATRISILLAPAAAAVSIAVALLFSAIGAFRWTWLAICVAVTFGFLLNHVRRARGP